MMTTALRVVADQSATRSRGQMKRVSRVKSASWPRLNQIGIPAEEIELRRQFIGGSDANVILCGEPDRVLRLWREKRGEEQPENLTSVLPVMLGSWSEAFNRQWYERQTGQGVTLIGAKFVCSEHGWRRASLDGFVVAQSAVFEAKHVGGFSRSEEILARYMPQSESAWQRQENIFGDSE